MRPLPHPSSAAPSALRPGLSCAVAVVLLAGAASAQHLGRPPGPPVDPPPSWYSGDTHDHVQDCEQSLVDEDYILAEMRQRGLDVSSLLVWEPISRSGPPAEPFVKHACRVTGAAEPATGAQLLQYGVETSGLDTSTWGHLIGLNIGADEARIASSAMPPGCYGSATGLGLGCPGGDGTGLFTAPIARHFAATRPQAVRGLAHQAWPIGLYSSKGYDWNTELVQTGVTSDAWVLDPQQRLAFPDVFATHQKRQVFPALGPMDVVLGNVEFLETGDMAYDYTFGPGVPTAFWFGAWYKLLNAGLRISPAGGSDRSCAPPGSQQLGLPRTWVRVDGALDYDGWTAGLAEGRVSVSMGNETFLDLSVDGVAIGGQVDVDAASGALEVEVTLHSSVATIERVQLLWNGEVVRNRRVRIPDGGGVATLVFQVPVVESGWFAARLRSSRAHTGATYVLHDQRPIARAEDAEYWMVWCDHVAKEVTDNPGGHFGCQDSEVFEQVSEARQLFRALRDQDALDGDFDPSWGVSRIGFSTPACRGPITMGVGGPAIAGQPLDVLCLNAPPAANGFLYMSTTRTSGNCISNARIYTDPSTGVMQPIRTESYRSGMHRIRLDDPGFLGLPQGTRVYAQFIWTNPSTCPSAGCDGTGSSISSSDALEIVLQ